MLTNFSYSFLKPDNSIDISHDEFKVLNKNEIYFFVKKIINKYNVYYYSLTKQIYFIASFDEFIEISDNNYHSYKSYSQNTEIITEMFYLNNTTYGIQNENIFFKYNVIDKINLIHNIEIKLQINKFTNNNIKWISYIFCGCFYIQSIINQNIYITINLDNIIYNSHTSLIINDKLLLISKTHIYLIVFDNNNSYKILETISNFKSIIFNDNMIYSTNNYIYIITINETDITYNKISNEFAKITNQYSYFIDELCSYSLENNIYQLFINENTIIIFIYNIITLNVIKINVPLYMKYYNIDSIKINIKKNYNTIFITKKDMIYLIFYYDTIMGTNKIIFKYIYKISYNNTYAIIYGSPWSIFNIDDNRITIDNKLRQQYITTYNIELNLKLLTYQELINEQNIDIINDEILKINFSEIYPIDYTKNKNIIENHINNVLNHNIPLILEALFAQ